MNIYTNGQRTWTQVAIGEDLPVQLVLLLETAEVVFVVVQQGFKAVYDITTDSVDAYFDKDGFAIGENSYSFNTPYRYKELPEMRKWLQEQKMVLDY